MINMRVCSHAIPLVLAAVLGIGTPVVAQNTTTLAKADGYFPEGFGLVSGFRTLTDGRVMVGDPLGQALVIIDLDRGTADTLGRVGAGPEEYRQPDRLFAWPGDSTLLLDLGNARMSVLSPHGDFVRTMPMTRPAEGAATAGPGGQPLALPSFIVPQAVDGSGRLYFRMFNLRRGPGSADSAAVGRWDPYTDRTDTVAMIKLPGTKTTRSGGPNNQSETVRPVPLSPADDWTVATDGRVAVVRAADYHVDWVTGDGIRSGPVRGYRPVRVRRAEKERYVDEGSGGLQVSVEVNNGRVQTGFGRGGGGRRNRDLDQYEWPDVLPAFRTGRAIVDPDGNVWVQRYVAAGAPSRYDVFDEAGRLVREVEMLPGRRVVGFGPGVLYAVYGDDFDLEYVERYRH